MDDIDLSGLSSGESVKLLKKAIEVLESIDTSIDFLAAAMTGMEPLDIELGQRAIGRLQRPFRPKGAPLDTKTGETEMRENIKISEALIEEIMEEEIKAMLEQDEHPRDWETEAAALEAEQAAAPRRSQQKRAKAARYAAAATAPIAAAAPAVGAALGTKAVTPGLAAFVSQMQPGGVLLQNPALASKVAGRLAAHGFAGGAGSGIGAGGAGAAGAAGLAGYGGARLALGRHGLDVLPGTSGNDLGPEDWRLATGAHPELTGGTIDTPLSPEGPQKQIRPGEEGFRPGEITYRDRLEEIIEEEVRKLLEKTK